MSPDASFFMPPKYLEKQRTHKPHMQHKFPCSQYKLAYFFDFCDLRARFPCHNTAQKPLQLFYSNTNRSVKNEQRWILSTHRLGWKCDVLKLAVLVQNLSLCYLQKTHLAHNRFFMPLTFIGDYLQL